jgi:hypothetical protein
VTMTSVIASPMIEPLMSESRMSAAASQRRG